MRRSRGFTLLEMVAVLVIISLLAAVVTFSFRNSIDGARDAEARANLERVVLAQRTWAAAETTWASSDELVVGRGLTSIGGVSTAPEQVSSERGPDNTLGLAVVSSSGHCLAKVLGDPMLSGAENFVTLLPTAPCSGAGALASS